MNSICIYHNGNSQVLNQYQQKYASYNFVGNWGVFNLQHNALDKNLYEISFADATIENLIKLKNNSVRLLRHISRYDDDQLYRVSECQFLTEHDWYKFAVINHLSFADEIYTDFVVPKIDIIKNRHAIITPGRTASLHYRYLIEKNGYKGVNCDKFDDETIRYSDSATLLWRKDLWECIVSHYIGSKYGYVHTLNNSPTINVEYYDTMIPESFIQNFSNFFITILDIAVYYRYVFDKPIVVVFTEDIINQTSNSTKNIYDKKTLIKNYFEMQQVFEKTYKNTIETAFNNTQKLLNLLSA